MAKIIFSKIARLDLKEILEYIKRDSVKYAYLEKRKIEDAIEILIKQPEAGRIVPDLDDKNIRELLFRNYRIIYQIFKNQIHIITIHHHSRLISNNPAFKDEE